MLATRPSGMPIDRSSEVASFPGVSEELRVGQASVWIVFAEEALGEGEMKLRCSTG